MCAVNGKMYDLSLSIIQIEGKVTSFTFTDSATAK